MNQTVLDIDDTQGVLSYFNRKGPRHTITFANLMSEFGFSQPYLNVVLKELVHREVIVKVGHGAWRRSTQRLRVLHDRPPEIQYAEPEPEPADPFLESILERRSRNERAIKEAEDLIVLYNEELAKLRSEQPMITRLLTMYDLGLLKT